MTDRIAGAHEIMRTFARSTGLSPVSASPRRYLWTDAFAVCNFLGLFQETEDTESRVLALRLVDQVHSTLGRYRQDDARSGWISGLDEEGARLHPTAGGLRIGKQLRERRPTEPLNERTEWDRDGQYFHYLTKWMYALNRVTRVAGDERYHAWATELARAVHPRFVYTPPSGRAKRMYWKMSTDLSYPLVQSMGLHDPLDGLITYKQLAPAGAGQPQGPGNLGAEIADMEEMCRGRNWITDDALGVGGLLSDSLRVAQLMTIGHFQESGLLTALLEAALVGLEALDMDGQMEIPPDHRLPFRELGLSIGLKALKSFPHLFDRYPAIFVKAGPLKKLLEGLYPYERLADAIESFWLTADHRGETWEAHGDINMVMLATSLLPAGYLAL
jgi:hypothetical protein